MATVPVTFAAVPVVFWFSVGISAATTALNVGTPAEPLGAAKNVLAVWLAKFDGKTASVPPKVKLPLVVTVPLRLRPLTVPVPPTEVTVPVVLDVPAPMAVRKSAAFRDETVLSALKRGNVIALGFVTVNRFEPSVVAPSAVRAAAAVVEPVPPFAMATVPVTLAAVPVVFWLPAVFTPGRLMFAEPLKLTPPMVRAVCSVVAVAALPVVLWLSVGTSAACMADISTFVPLPLKYWPLVTAPAKVFIAACAVVASEPPRATLRVPVVPATIGRPVAFVSVADEGVPSAGVTKVGEVANTADPLPVSSVNAPAS